VAPRICQRRVPRELHRTDARHLQTACTPVTRYEQSLPRRFRPPVVRAGSAKAHRAAGRCRRTCPGSWRRFMQAIGWPSS
jgi:hypothetical protein